MMLRLETNNDLRAAFRKINSFYFNDKLPLPTKIRFGKTPKDTLAATYFYKGNRIPFDVIIKKFKVQKFVLHSLIHEMIHIKFHSKGLTTKKFGCKPPKRGCWSDAPWGKEVRRLAKTGLLDWLL